MKSLFYYVFGIVTALLASLITFKLCYREFLDDYYIEMLHQHYWDVYLAIASGISILFLVLTWSWMYNLGKGTNHEKREPLLINKSEENE